ncbi:MAG: ATP-dependent helicase [Candidatus Taylorbacteria bacterium]|nr:ATP-dependent helicase [Candidatus Taylorbacteria bacterium]
MSDSAFQAQYARLNPKQKEAVDTIDGPVMVIAGPGTGKTTVLTLRIAQILRKTDTPPSGILAITFTEAGVKAMRQKLRALMGSRADEVRLHTFHGFASSIIAEFKDHFAHLDRAIQMTDIDAESLVREILKDERFAELRPFGNPDFYVQKIVGGISDAKREALTPEMMREGAKKEKKSIQADPDALSSRGPTKGKLKAEAEKRIEKCERTVLFADVYEVYEKRKRAERKIDFNDLIIELLTALQNDTLLLRLLQEKFLYILVDEHQDTNDSQNLLIRLLADFFDSPNLFVVGDEKQAIYRFQGASVENFLRFKNAWKGMKSIPLETNYRSHQHLLDSTFSMIENNYGEGEHTHLRVRLTSGGGGKPQPLALISGKECDTLEYLGKEIQAILEKENESTMAIITKTNRDLERIIRFLESKEIPVSSERKINIFNHPIGNLFFTLIEYLSDTTNTEALAKTIAVGLWDVPFENGVECIRALRSGKQGVAEKIPALRHLQNKLTDEGALAYLVFLAEASGFLTLAVKDPSAMEVWRGIVELSEYLIREGDIRDTRELLAKLLSYKASSEERSVKVSVGSPELRVRAMTAHGSKGLEFDYVFLPFVTESSWIGRTRGTYFVFPHKEKDDEDSIRDARRLFYVALTRAKKHAVVLVPEEIAGGKTETPLRFLDELDPKCVERTVLPPDVGGLHSPFFKGSTSSETGGISTHNRKLIDLTKTTLLNSGLSVTALNHFITCPSAFLYQSILKIPQASTPSAEKGTAVHEAFRRIWEETDRSIGTIEKVFRDSVSAYLERSLLPVFEKEAVKTELFEKAPSIAQELQSHFASGKAVTESWSEGHFSGTYEGGQVTMPVHGKLDAVLEDGDTVRVFDYKTKEAMTVPAIKGETKSSDGNPWRQLIFYKFLLEHNPKYKNKDIVPSLVFVMPDRKGKCGIVSLPVADADIEKLKTEIQSLIDSVWSGRVMTDFCDEPECEWCRLKKLVVGR